MPASFELATTLIRPGGLGTHRFALVEFERADDVFADAAGTGALKVVLTACHRLGPTALGRDRRPVHAAHMHGERSASRPESDGRGPAGPRRDSRSLRRRLRAAAHIHRPTWRHHPGVRSGDQLTRGERAADALRNGMGSWTFVLLAIVFLAGWTLGNRNVGFDKYPFILLNLVLSCLAALQGSILLIAAKRADQISSELAHHDYETNCEADDIVKEIRALAREIHAATVKGEPDAPHPVP